MPGRVDLGGTEWLGYAEDEPPVTGWGRVKELGRRVVAFARDALTVEVPVRYDHALMLGGIHDAAQPSVVLRLAAEADAAMIEAAVPVINLSGMGDAARLMEGSQ